MTPRQGQVHLWWRPPDGRGPGSPVERHAAVRHARRALLGNWGVAMPPPQLPVCWVVGVLAGRLLPPVPGERRASAHHALGGVPGGEEE